MENVRIFRRKDYEKNVDIVTNVVFNLVRQLRWNATVNLQYRIWQAVEQFASFIALLARMYYTCATPVRLLNGRIIDAGVKMLRCPIYRRCLRFTTVRCVGRRGRNDVQPFRCECQDCPTLSIVVFLGRTRCHGRLEMTEFAHWKSQQYSLGLLTVVL